MTMLSVGACALQLEHQNRSGRPDCHAPQPAFGTGERPLQGGGSLPSLCPLNTYSSARTQYHAHLRGRVQNGTT